MLRRLAHRTSDRPAGRQALLLTVFLALVPGLLSAAIWTEEFYGLNRTSLQSAAPKPSPVWEEYGFEEAEAAEYAGNGVKLKATAYRFHDSTGAFAAYQWMRPEGYQPADVLPLALETADSLFLAHGNYILHFEGKKPSIEELKGLFLVLPMTENSALPELAGYLPTEGLIPRSERFVVGPASLAHFEPRIKPSIASFQYGTEAQLARYNSPTGDLSLIVFSYPTPHIARERLAEFRMIPRALVKRAGPMIVVTLDPPDQDHAQQLLAKVNYRATIVWDDPQTSVAGDLADLLLTIGALVGLLLLVALGIGFFLGGSRFLFRGRKGGPEEDPMILLHLDDR
ncbi:MAG: hypothetical protein KIT09_09705 [Bryobacteraceae bacterium]|nr:hypothetical protein [Bryobacteraceae bacterium]